MNESSQHEPRDVTSLSRKSWTAYFWPVVLTVLGFILPALAKREQTAAKK